MSLTRIPVELGERSYPVVVGPGALGELGTVLAGRRRAAIVSHDEIAVRYAAAVQSALDAAGIGHQLFTFPAGEEHKSLRTVEDLCERMAAWGLLRGDAVVALGGGLVGDVAGFTASAYYRGIDVVQVPTTLLAMVDASIGGKTGVNLPQGKNLVGAFHQPLAVLADPDTLADLPDREFRCGLGEVAKYALMGDTELVDLLRLRLDDVLAREPAVVAQVVARCAATKARYVAVDEFERTGVRAHLNYGHTLAHAIETEAAYALAHGEAVAVGLVFAGNLAAALGRVGVDAAERHHGLVAGLGLPTNAPAGLDAERLLEVMARDKKSAGGLTFVLQGPNGLERVDDPPRSALRSAFAAVGVDCP